MDGDKKSLKDNLKKALEKRALGYEYEEKIIFARKDDDGNPKDARMKIIKKHIPPDPQAIKQIREEMRLGRW